MINLFKRIYNMAGKFKKEINISIILQFFDSMLAFVPLSTVMLFFKHYTENTLTDKFYLVAFGILIGGVIARTLVRYYIDKNQYSTLYSIMADERIKIANHLKKINMGFFSNDNIGRVTTILTNGISFIEERGMVSAVESLTALITTIVILIGLLSMNIIVGLIYISIVIIVFAILYIYNKKTIEFASLYNKSTENTSGAVIEYVKNIAVIKAFNLIGRHQKSSNAFIENRKTDLKGEMVNIPYLIGAMIVMALGTGGILWYLTTYYQNQGMLMYNVIVLSIVSLYVFSALTTIALKIVQANISNDGLIEISKLYDQKIMEEKASQVPENYDIEFKNVTFAYEKENVINDVSFILKQNTMTVLVGLSGSGKSTIVNLIPRFFDINKGKITIGGVNIKNMSAEILYNMISMVFQNVYLFKDTVYNNIVFGNEKTTKEEVIEACKKAKCYDFIMSLPEQFDTLIGEGGLSFSGGERQRISIARAILKDSPIILLDEATASVDTDNESDIQEAINELVKDKTILVIAHKLSAARNADNIIVLKDGKIEETGRHEELSAKDGLYSNLWKKRVQSKSWKIKK